MLFFIAGFGDDTFRPDDSVTAEQLLTMLVSAVGYNEYAQSAGGYPNGYGAYAGHIGIIGEYDSVSYKHEVTRKALLTCAANTLNVPICIIEKYEVNIFGGYAPVFAIKDGTGKDFNSLLTERHGTFKVSAVVNSVKDNVVDVDITQLDLIMNILHQIVRFMSK